jgi:hypothetical protein
MRRANSVFSPQERKAAVWALLMAAAVASLGLVVDRWSQPSIGPDGAAAYAYAPAVGELDARPVDLASGV